MHAMQRVRDLEKELYLSNRRYSFTFVLEGVAFPTHKFLGRHAELVMRMQLEHSQVPAPLPPPTPGLKIILTDIPLFQSVILNVGICLNFCFDTYVYLLIYFQRSRQNILMSPVLGHSPNPPQQRLRTVIAALAGSRGDVAACGGEPGGGGDDDRRRLHRRR